MATNSIRNLYKLYVANIPWTISNLELKQYFSKFGHVYQSKVVFDKKTGLSKNYGFVSFSNREGFENATNAPSHQLEGNSLKVEPTNTAHTSNE
ncbi:SRA stem-loop-interacting RNA-binding protein, mitochondrial-like [Leptinotarsa decemlineata]|uniref:SRA stem-loop-interacting RNA-binding protein, mitochondrial-like n=1 Tax=Leptinotarsa decemlineata TaxID=7539 RepID=UPI000C252DD9|nr:SRA stem-loop-interacting RNA-binding protein, mitochondrial-like [Leptinotarsa decemlineata]